MAASRPTVVAGKDGSIAVKRQMQVNLTADHRVIYGADGAAFLKDLAELIEEMEISSDQEQAFRDALAAAAALGRVCT